MLVKFIKTCTTEDVLYAKALELELGDTYFFDECIFVSEAIKYYHIKDEIKDPSKSFYFTSRCFELVELM